MYLLYYNKLSAVRASRKQSFFRYVRQLRLSVFTCSHDPKRYKTIMLYTVVLYYYNGYARVKLVKVPT